MKRIAVYCGSATPEDTDYIEAAMAVGEGLAKRGIGVVYGGGRLGLMGAVADSALNAGGEVIGVIPEALRGAEVAHLGCTELHVVDNMHQRKAMFTDLSDGFINLPGGVGTMDELWEAISWAQLGYHQKPVGVLNIKGYYDHLIRFNAHMADVGFVRDQHKGIMVVDDNLDGLLGKMERYEPHKTIFSMKADDL
ncbi:TIGR00730 family Rossman fold protein [Sphingorhabdus sp. Alg239-R122]|uniref:LOG family protein n=1 Tax=Sphingorhabdus sp. Alg239-R122 TaxID=2305989 RepID=UPI0013D9A7DF|nr:TIGR00730 family Rossman fold protein [Sphingorhabdus sp. Alg239-R122]